MIAAGRGRLPFARLHGEPLLTHALRRAAEVTEGVLVVVDDDCESEAAAVTADSRVAATLLDEMSWWAGRDGHSDLLHDPLCPLVPATFLGDLLGRAGDGVALAAYRPVTDTVKTAIDGRISGTLDRERLGIVVAPVLLPGGLGAGEEMPPLEFAGLVDWLRDRIPVELVRAPSRARRVDDESAVQLLECVDETARRVR